MTPTVRDLDRLWQEAQRTPPDEIKSPVLAVVTSIYQVGAALVAAIDRNTEARKREEKATP